jgi:diaminopimelate epimerase
LFGDEARIATDGGIKEVWLESRDLVRVDMGVPEVSPRSESITTEWGTWNFYRCDMGNPHAVIFVDDVAKIPLEKVGPKIENDPRFPHRTNVEFVQVVGSHLKVRVWERGAGVTLACGTGACASAAVAIFLGKVGRKLRVVLPGGELGLEWPTNEDPIFMTGPATKVFEGELCELQR